MFGSFFLVLSDRVVEFLGFSCSCYQGDERSHVIAEGGCSASFDAEEEETLVLLP